MQELSNFQYFYSANSMSKMGCTCEMSLICSLPGGSNRRFNGFLWAHAITQEKEIKIHLKLSDMNENSPSQIY